VLAQILRRLTPIGDDEVRGLHLVDQDTSARRQLDGFVRSYMRDAAAEPTRLRGLYVLIGESLGGMDEIDDEVANVNAVFRDHIAAYISLGQDQGEFRADLDPDLVAVVVERDERDEAESVAPNVSVGVVAAGDRCVTPSPSVAADAAGA